MSRLLIQQYLNELQTLRRVSGTARDGVVSEAFTAADNFITNDPHETSNDNF